MLTVVIYIVKLLLVMQEGLEFLKTIPTVVYILGIVVLIISALLVFSKKTEYLQVIDKKTAEGNEKLIKTRDLEIIDLEKRLQDNDEEKESILSEYKALAGINLEKLVEYWLIRETELAQKDLLESELRRYKKLVEHYEREAIKSKKVL